MIELLYFISAGAIVGLAVGLTGVGGGSLMTPFLILFGIPYNVAIGTDLLYAAITKAGGMVTHARQKTIEWRIMGLLALGSIPASLLTTHFLSRVFTDSSDYQSILTLSLGVMLVLTSIVIIFRGRLSTDVPKENLKPKKYSDIIVLFAGIFLGVFVTLSSVGAGAFGAAVLMLLYPYLKTIKIIGTDIAHAVPLTLIAGLGHFVLGNVDLILLGSLLIGSLPAIHFGTKLAKRMPSDLLQTLIALILLGLGTKFIVG
ncbi:MAG: sulfite exporter TauE/SafE family protein [Porticoccaceae bacterium]